MKSNVITTVCLLIAMSLLVGLFVVYVSVFVDRQPQSTDQVQIDRTVDTTIIKHGNNVDTEIIIQHTVRKCSK
jgi:cytochrome oxidase Cu insertion factor (SCO1/SenC/PrrC family)